MNRQHQDRQTRPIRDDDPVGDLRRVLLANGVFSTVVGIAAVAWGAGLGALTGLPPVALAIVGAATAAGGLFLIAVTSPRSRPFLVEWTGWTTFFSDAIWVAGSLAVLLNGRLPLTPAGRGLIFALAEVVALFTFLELRALRGRLATRPARPARRATPPRPLRGR